MLELHWQLTGNRAQFSVDPRQMMARGDELTVGDAESGRHAEFSSRR